MDIYIQISILFLDTDRRIDAPEITKSDSAPCSQTTDSGTTNTCAPQIKIFWLYEVKIILIPRKQYCEFLRTTLSASFLIYRSVLGSKSCTHYLSIENPLPDKYKTLCSDWFWWLQLQSMKRSTFPLEWLANSEWNSQWANAKRNWSKSTKWTVNSWWILCKRFIRSALGAYSYIVFHQ